MKNPLASPTFLYSRLYSQTIYTYTTTMSDPNGLSLTTSNTSSLVSNSSSLLSSTNNKTNTLSKKLKNAVLNRKRSKSFIISDHSIDTPSSLRTFSHPNRNRSLSSIQYSPIQMSTMSFENNNNNNSTNYHSISDSTSSISDTELSSMDGPITPITPLFKINEASRSEKFTKLEQNPNNKMINNEQFFDTIADGILERINTQGDQNQIDWSI